jgi:hypothetical protein
VSAGTDHRYTIASFLRTDRYRLEAALDELEWSPATAERIVHHLRYSVLVREVYLGGRQPREAALDEMLQEIDPRSMEEALDLVGEVTDRMIEAMESVAGNQLHAPVLDPHQRNLTVLGHLYDYCRANAMLVEWAQGRLRDWR